jgi:hypothetical protein
LFLRSISAIAFHEKAVRSQVDSISVWLSIMFLCRRVAAIAAILPSALSERSALGASWAFSFQPVLPPVRRPAV